MSHPVYNVLFLCKTNAARSLMAEVMMNHWGHGHFQAFSAGSQPAAAPHPTALGILQAEGFATEHLRSKNWQEYVGEDAPQMDFIFTLCDEMEADACPAWPGEPVTGFWHFANPVQPDADPAAEQAAFAQVQMQIANRIRLFLSLPEGTLAQMAHHPHGPE